jgi:MFS family permease
MATDATIEAPGEAPRPSGTFASLHYRDFRYLWLGQVGHAASLWMEQIARPVLILQLTDSALMVGLVVAARMIPMLIFGLFAGVVADRFNKKRILLTTQAVTMSVQFLTAALVISGLIEVWMVFITTFIAGTSMSFNQPARQSILPKLVPRESLLNAVALNTSAINIMRIVGPAIAGVLLFIGIGSVYLVQGFILAVVMLVTSLMHVPSEPRPREEQISMLGDLRESLRFVAETPVVLSIMGPALILFVFGFPYQSVFVPLFAKQVFELGNSGVGWLTMVTGAGALAGSLFLASRGTLGRRGLVLLGCLALFSTGLLLISRSEYLAFTIVVLAGTACMSNAYISLTNSLLLELSPEEMHGRVMSLLSLDRGLVPLGATIAGALATTLGPEDALLVMSLICLSLTALVAVAAPALRRL